MAFIEITFSPYGIKKYYYPNSCQVSADSDFSIKIQINRTQLHMPDEVRQLIGIGDKKTFLVTIENEIRSTEMQKYAAWLLLKSLFPLTVLKNITIQIPVRFQRIQISRLRYKLIEHNCICRTKFVS